MTPENAARFPCFDVDFARLTTHSLVVCGAEDDPHFTPRGPEWHADADHDGPGSAALRGPAAALGTAELQAKEREAAGRRAGDGCRPLGAVACGNKARQQRLRTPSAGGAWAVTKTGGGKLLPRPTTAHERRFPQSDRLTRRSASTGFPRPPCRTSSGPGCKAGPLAHTKDTR